MCPESQHNVGFIGPKSKTPGLACQTSLELEDARRYWPISNGGHILKLADELFYIAVPSENQGLEVVPVTSWPLNSPLNF